MALRDIRGAQLILLISVSLLSISVFSITAYTYGRQRFKDIEYIFTTNVEINPIINNTATIYPSTIITDDIEVDTVSVSDEIVTQSLKLGPYSGSYVIIEPQQNITTNVTITIPANLTTTADFVLTEGNQTINGQKTFTDLHATSLTVVNTTISYITTNILYLPNTLGATVPISNVIFTTINATDTTSGVTLTFYAYKSGYDITLHLVNDIAISYSGHSLFTNALSSRWAPKGIDGIHLPIVIETESVTRISYILMTNTAAMIIPADPTNTTVTWTGVMYAQPLSYSGNLAN